MPNAITSTGIVVMTRAELTDYYESAYRAIYGADINLASDSPDGQLIGIWVQSVVDFQDLLVQIYNQFDPDLAQGRVLDERCAINGIQRQAGTFTTTNITLVITQSVTLYGLDQTVRAPYTVSDNAGNKWVLQTTQTPSIADTYVYLFQSAVPGAVVTVPNTITNPVSVVLGIDSINNPTTYATLGLNEETDAELKIRRQQSTTIGSQGYLQGLLAALENIDGMSSVFVYENTTGSTDGDGIPSHSIWVITSGTAAPVEIANAIYQKRNAGCGMKGNQTYIVTQSDGSSFELLWDNVTPVNLFIKFTATSLDGVNDPNIAAIRSGLVTSFVPGVSEEVNINALATAVQVIDPNTLVTSAGFSLSSGGSYTNTLTPATKDLQFVVSSPDIIILAIILSPHPAPGRTVGQTIQFSSVGGYGAYTYTINTNVSGGSITSPAGLYTAGATPGTDVVRVTDAAGNFTQVNVVVS